MADITAQNGSKIRTFPHPPSGFDPLTAAAAELEHYGFPPRGVSGVLLSCTVAYGAG